MWFLNRLAPGAIAYNFQFTLRFRGALDTGALRRALAEIVSRHEVLRTTFPALDGRGVQVVHPPFPVELPVVDLTHLPAARREAAAQREIHREIRRGFDLDRLPLLRWQLFRLAPDHHLLLHVEHHFVHDGWSLAVFLREVKEIYGAFAAGRPCPLPPPPLQYADFALWQRRFLAGPALARQLAYWKERIGDHPPVLELPTDHPRPKVHSFRGDCLRADLPHALYEAVRALGRREGFTLFVAMLAAFDVLLYRLTGQEDFLLGSGVANRRLRESEAMIGMVVNTVVLRTPLAGEMSFRDLLARVRRTMLEAHEHQDLPFEKLVQELQPERDLSRNPLFQVLFSFHDAPVPDLEWDGLAADIFELHNGSAKSDLNVVAKPRAEQRLGLLPSGGDELTMVWEFATDLYERATIERMWGHFQNLLAGVVEDAGRRLSELPLLSPAERLQLAAWNETTAPAPAEPLVHRLFEEQARRAPGALAVAGGGRRLTYGELDAAANRLARRLSALGVGAETPAALLLERSPELVLAALAVLKAGGTYLPLDPAYPPERLAFMLEDSGAVVLLTQEALFGLANVATEGTGKRFQVGRMEGVTSEGGGAATGSAAADGSDIAADTSIGGATHAARPRVDRSAAFSLPGSFAFPAAGTATLPVLCVDRELEQLAEEPLPDHVSLADQLAYVIYTSGSTGRPKGVEVTHGGLGNLVAWHRHVYAVGERDRATVLAGPAFDASVWEVWPYLAAGASLHVPEPAVRSEPERLLGWLAAEGITLCFLPTPLAEAVIELPAPAGLALRAVLTGGDRLRRAPAAGLPYRLVNHYGPTESAVVTSAGEVAPRPSPAAPPGIGRPIANTRVSVVDRDWNPMPPGVPGELWVGGRGLARGYRGRPDLTAERFVPDAWSGEPGGRLYRSGDLVRFRPGGGDLEFLGRIDHQVKVRGFRIEPGEIEVVLAALPEVASAVVLAPEDGRGDRRLVAYVVPRSGETDGAAGLPADLPAALAVALAAKLPDYMVPGAFVVLDRLPLTPNGKVDLRALPAPEVAAAAGDEWAAPRPPTEELVAGIWARVLGAPRAIGAHDDFWKLGGHSLLATQILSRVRDATGAEVPLQTLFEHPALADFARAVDEALRAGVPPPEPIVRRPAGVEPPLSFAQERLWFLDRLTPGEAAYTIARAYHLAGPLDVAAFARAALEVVRRHEALRTTFGAPGVRPPAQRAVGSAAGSDEGGPVQRVADPPAAVAALVDLQALPAAARAAEAERLALETARRPYDLERGPLLRVALLRGAPARHRLLLGMHHIISDGWSIARLLGELGTLYSAFRRYEPSPLPPLPVQYGDFALWQRRRLAGEALFALSSFWTSELEGAPGLLELPTDRRRPAVQAYRGAQEARRLADPMTAALRELAESTGATLFIVLAAALAALFHRLSGQDDVVVGTPIAGRTRSELEPLVGFFVNTVALRARCEEDGQRFDRLVARLRAATLAAHAHQEMPFEKLVEELAPERSLAHAPIFQAVFSLQNMAREELALAGVEVEPLPVERHEARFDLELAASACRGDAAGLEITWRYDRDLWDGTTVARWAGHLETLLAAAAREPGRAVAELPLLSPAERVQLLVEWNGAVLPYPRERCVHELVEERARRAPQAVAVVAGDERLTYAELDRRSNRLARRLRALGVGTETRVGVGVERSADLVVTLLAVLKAGGAYVPLDPGSPRERLAGMAADGGVEVLVAEERWLPALPDTGARLLCLEREAAAIAAESAAPLPPAALPESLAYVLFTSGSTGRPKGVAVPHRAIVRLVRGNDFAHLREGDVFLQLAPVAFDASTLEIWGALANGARLAVFPPHTPSLGELGEFVARQGVTVLWLTAGLFHQMVEEQLPALAGVTQLLAGGDVLSPAHVGLALGATAAMAATAADTGDRVVVNGYGPTENTTFTCCHALRRGDRVGDPVPIGRPIGNTRVVLLDRAFQPVPPGVPGELCAGGDGLARGYAGRPDLTAERFVPDPIGGQRGERGEPGARLYRTGDLARWLPSGAIDFLGRLDGQVKIRGFRVEPGEVEAVLAAHPAVRAAAVVTREDGDAAGAGDRRLAAYVVPAAAPAAGVDFAAELRAHLAAHLPDYMVPAALVLLDALPLTPSGKLDRRALPAPGGEALASRPAYEPPAGDDERTIAAVWQELLGLERVGRHDDFFDLGGHSLLATRAVARLSRLFELELPLRALFQDATVAGLARAVERVRREGERRAAPAITRLARTAQRRPGPAGPS